MPTLIELAGSDFDSPNGKASLYTEPENIGEVPINLVDPEAQSIFDSESERVEEVVDATGALIDASGDIQKMNPADTGASAYNALRAVTEKLMRTIDPQKAYFPVMEQYAGLANKRQVLQRSFEAMSDLIIAGVRHIVEWIKKVGIWVRNLFQKARTSSEGIATRAKRIQDDAKDAIIKKLPKDAAVTSDTLLRYFSADGTAIKSDHIAVEYKRYTSEIGGTFGVDLVKRAGDQVLAVIPEVTKDTDKAAVLGKIDPIITDLRNQLLKHFKEGFGDQKSDANNHIISYKLPFNNESLVCTIQIEDGKQTSMKMLGQDVKTKGQVKDKSLDVLSANEVGMLAKLVEEQATYGIYKQHDTIVGEVNKIENAINKATNDLVKMIEAKPQEAKKDMYSLEFLRSIFTAMAKYVDLFYNYDVRAAGRILDYCEASLLKYE